jgi:hypothetical protein
MSSFIIVKKDSLSISQSFTIADGEIKTLIINPTSGSTSSDSFELPFIIKSCDMTVPIISEEFCLVSRDVIRLSEQHANEAQATLSGNKQGQMPQKAWKENGCFIELKAENG